MSTRGQHNGLTVIDDLLSLLRRPEPLPRLERGPAKGPLPPARGYAEDNTIQVPGSDSGSGIASPLTEGAGGSLELARTYHPKRTLRSSDGLFVWEVAPVATIRFTDANGGAAEFRLAVPTEPDP